MPYLQPYARVPKLHYVAFRDEDGTHMLTNECGLGAAWWTHTHSHGEVRYFATEAYASYVARKLEASMSGCGYSRGPVHVRKRTA